MQRDKMKEDNADGQTLSAASSNTSLDSMLLHEEDAGMPLMRAWTIHHIQVSKRHVPCLTLVRSLSEGDVWKDGPSPVTEKRFVRVSTAHAPVFSHTT